MISRAIPVVSKTRFPHVVLALALGACANTAKPSVATVSALEAALAAAGRGVLACYALPACAAYAPKPTIKVAYDSAYTAVTAAQTAADAGGTPDLTAATAAIATLQGLITSLPIKG
jgi:hypothetical protein